MNKSGRIEYIDFIKGFAIFLVVWAHSIQNMGSENSFWENPVFYTICSFHMPLFMLLSGFFFRKKSINDLFDLTKKKFRQLIFPCIAWSLVLITIGTCYMLYDGEPINVIERIKSWIYESATRFWFLRSVFICYILAAISFRILKKDYLACICSILLFLLISDNFRLALDKFLFPYFWAGYFIHKNIDYLTSKRLIIMSISLSLFILMLLFWRKDYYIYITGMSFYEIKNGQLFFHDIMERLHIVIYRYTIGFMGSIFLFFILQSIYRSSFQYLTTIGKYTLGIYTIHLFIEGDILGRLNLSNFNFFIFNFIITPITSVILIIICIQIIKLIQKNRFTNTFFLGAEFINKR